MKLRTKLILAFLLLAVIPLSGLTAYSYISSTRAFRQAVEAETAQMTANMTRSMEGVRRDLDRRVRELGARSFYRLAASDLQELKPDVEGIYGEFIRELGDAASLIHTLEFEPEVSAAGSPPPWAPPPPPLKVREQMKEVHESVVVYLPGTEVDTSDGDEIETSPEDEVSVETSSGERIILRHRIPGPPPPPPAGLQGFSKRGGERRIPPRRELRLSMPQSRALAEEKRRELAVMRLKAETAAVEAAMAERAKCLDFASKIQVSQQAWGNIKAQVNFQGVLRRVFSGARMEKGEVPFAIDPTGHLFTPYPDKLEILENLNLKPGDSIRVSSLSDEWMLVTKEDSNTGITFGVARPIGEGLQEIRETTARNLGYGALLIGISLLGILPLSNRMTRNLNTLMAGAQKLSVGDLETRVPVRSKDEFGKLSATFNQMAADLKTHQNQLLEQERIRKELEMCRQIQREMLPKVPLKLPFAEVQGVSIPAREVGGDFFNYFSMASREVAILVGDVSGKGVPAALLMANIQATLKAKLPAAGDLASLLKELDEEVNASTPTETFLTLFLAVLDQSGKILRWVNAGHNTQYLLRADGSIENLSSSGRPLGLLPGSEYVVESTDFSSGDALFLYTDGLVEAEDNDERGFGNQRLEKILLDERNSPAEALLSRIEEALRDFRGVGESSDDATMVLLRSS